MSTDRYVTTGAIWSWNLVTDHVDYSAHWCAVVGCSQDQLSGSMDDWAKRIHPDDREASLARMDEFRRGRAMEMQFEHRLLTHTRGYRVIQRRVMATRDSTGAAMSITGMDRDVTERQVRARMLRATREELEVARAIQHSMLPSTMPRVPGFEVQGRSWPAEVVGGDYFDFIPIRNQEHVIAIGDASGHGLGPALVMAEMRAAVRTLAGDDHSLGEILHRTNRILLEGTPASSYATLALVHLDPSTRRIRYMNAGHAPAFLFNARGDLREDLRTPGHPLGLLPEPEFLVNPTLQMEPGDVLLLVTDGVSEAFNASGELFGNARIKEVVSGATDLPAHLVVDRLYAAIREHCGSTPPADDVTMVAIKAAAPGPPDPSAGSWWHRVVG